MNNDLKVSELGILEKKELFNNLFDFYGELLTDKQRAYFQDYSFEDMSLSEIATTYGVSRNAIFDQISKVYTNLLDYEKKLGLYQKFQELENILNQYKNSSSLEVLELIKKIEEIE